MPKVIQYKARKSEDGNEAKIAIVGISCKFPDAEDYHAYWNNLASSKSSIKEVPKDRWYVDDYYSSDATRPNSTVSRWGGFLENVDAFDAKFFNISSREAVYMDPQQRLMLELAWSCIEDAGYSPQDFRGSDTGVFIGSASNDYKELLVGPESAIEGHAATGTFSSLIPNRISYEFDFKSTSLQIDTACSSSLVALHQAVTALKNGECSTALAGGVSLICTPTYHVAFSKAGMLSPTGKCRSFDENADGYVRGEGAALVLLKPLDKALADGDHVYGLVAGSVVNHGGKVSTVTSPSLDAQYQMLVDVFRKSGLSPDKISYVEAHGSGTQKGDPAEFNALVKAYQAMAESEGIDLSAQSCGVGSVKTNIGHLEAAAGIAGIVKVLMSLKHKAIPASLNFESLNSNIKLEGSPFRVVTEFEAWEAHPDGEPRRAGVSSFGFGGVNSHILIEEYVEPPKQQSVDSSSQRPNPELIILSARTNDQLAAIARRLVQHIKTQNYSDDRLSNIAYTLQVGRKPMKYRWGMVVSSMTSLLDELSRLSTNSAAMARCVEPSKSGTTTSDPVHGSLSRIDNDFEEPELNKLLQLWLGGENVDWRELYNGGSLPARLNLPTYPFARSSFWIGHCKNVNPRPVGSKFVFGNHQDSTGIEKNTDISPKELQVRNEAEKNHDSSSKKRLLSPVDFSSTSDSNQSDEPSEIENIPLDSVTSPHSAQVASSVVDTRRDIEARLRASLAELMFIDEDSLDEDSSFVELGLDSIISVEWLRWIENEFGRKLTVSILYDHSTVRNLAGHLASQLSTTIDDDSTKEIPDSPASVVPASASESQKSFTLGEVEDGNNQRPCTIQELQSCLLSSLSEIFYVDVSDVELDAVFIELGLDSILSAEWIRWINSRFGLQQSVSVLYDHPSVQQLSNYLMPLILNEARVTSIDCGSATVVDHSLSPPALETASGASSASSGSLRDATIEMLTKSLAEVLYVEADEIASDVSFVELGIDSIIGAEWTRFLKNEFSSSITVSTLYDFPTIADLAMHLVGLGAERTVSENPSVSENVANEPSVSIPAPTRDEQIEKGYAKFDHDLSLQPEKVNEEVDSRAIAIIGVSGQFPESSNLEEYWKNLSEGVNCVSDVPLERWGLTDTSLLSCQKMGVLENADKFDPRFFELSPAEAEVIDPQQRLFLQSSWQCIEDAGINPKNLSGKSCGVFVGSLRNNYGINSNPDSWTAQALIGNSVSILAARIAFYLNLNGPCLTIDTACSSSLVAIAEACNNLILGNCDLALAGGVSVLPDPSLHVMAGRGGMLSEDGRCFAFDDKANGFVPSEGVGAVLLKPLADAQRDGDPIKGVIRAWGVNQDGRTNGITAPSCQSQISLEKQVHEKFGIDPDSISLLEAHGTGTKLGDPIEVEALINAFDSTNRKEASCALGSAKSCIGHSLAAAGVASVIKGLLAIQNKKIPPVVGFENLNEHIEIEGSPFYINSSLVDWELGEQDVRRCAINSFGFSGTNAHLVLEEYISPVSHSANEGSNDGSPVAVVLSAKGESQLKKAAANLLSFIEHQDYAYQDLVSLAYTLQVGREAMNYRFAVTASSVLQLKEKLRGFLHAGPDHTELNFDNKKSLPELLQQFGGEAKLQELSSSWLKQRDWPRLLQAWCKGFDVDWNALYLEGGVPSRISLPTYPFLDYSFWKLATEIPYQGDQQTSFNDEVVKTHAELTGANNPGFKNELHADENAVASQTADWLNHLLRSTLSSLLCISEDDIEDDLPFSELGLDSISSVEWMKTINSETGGSVEASEIYNYPTLEKFKEYLIESFEHSPLPDISRGRFAIAGESPTVLTSVTAAPAPASEDRSLNHRINDVVAHSEVSPEGDPTTIVGSQDQEILIDGVELTQFLQRSLGEMLHLNSSDIESDIPFIELGLDSINGVEWVGMINQKLEIDISASDIYNNSTIEKFARFIAEHKGVHSLDAKAKTPSSTSETGNPGVLGLKRTSTVQIKDVSLIPEAEEGIESSQNDAIAVIGISCQFAGSPDVDTLWKNLENGKELIEPALRWGADVHKNGLSSQSEQTCTDGGFVKGIDEFDSDFFRLSPLECKYMDPQQRLLLSNAWKVTEDAGYAGTMAGRRCGVYVGCCGSDYSNLFSSPPPQAFWGNATSVVAGRIAYHFDLEGPAVTIDTACSSSLVALHAACQSLRSGEIDMAISGGVTLLCTPSIFVQANDANMLSPTGKCYAFDERADGFVPGEGVALVMLKRVEDALRDKDHIYGLIKGSGINHDGETNGITAPNGISQEQLIRSVHKQCGISASQIQMAESHGTGTKLGDPIEFKALASALTSESESNRHCALGSIKTNVGHTMAAAGVAGLIKVLLSIKNKKIPPSLNFGTGNPAIDFENSPLYVNTELKNWDVTPSGKRVATVSSFGFSGTNAHIVVEEGPSEERVELTDSPSLIALSAMNEEQLQDQASALVSFCERNPSANLADISFTLLTGRKHFEYRIALVVDNVEQLKTRLSGWLRNERSQDLQAGRLSSDIKGQGSSSGNPDDNYIYKYQKSTSYAEKQELLAAVSQLYVQGAVLDYADLFYVGSAYRIPLPTYPFANTRYWVDNSDSQSASESIASSELSQANKQADLDSGGSPGSHFKDSTVGNDNKAVNLLVPQWHPQEISSPADNDSAIPGKVLLCDVQADSSAGEFDHDGYLSQAAREKGANQFSLFVPDSEDLPTRVLEVAEHVFLLVQESLKSNQTPSLLQIVIPLNASGLLLEALYPLLLTARKENPNFRGQLIEVGSQLNLSEVLELLERESHHGSNLHIRHDGELRKIRSWVPSADCDVSRDRGNSPWSNEGVYLITGGAGGLGLIVSRAIAENCSHCKLILVGRSTLGTEQEASLDLLRDLGATVKYLQIDVADKQSVEFLVSQTVAEHGRINGVIHAAGIIRDSYITHKTLKDFNSVLNPKISGLVNLDEATSDISLDFFACFSSIAGVLGNVGQADYAAANGFMDAYSEFRQQLVENGERSGASISINWPLWSSGGMAVDDIVESDFRDLGIYSISAEEGLAALNRLFELNLNRALVFNGNVSQCDKIFNSAFVNESSRTNTVGKISKNEIVVTLEDIFSGILEIDKSGIDRNESFSNFGLDSLLIIRLNREVEKYFGEQSKTLFFEYDSLAEIGDYLSRQDNLIKLDESGSEKTVAEESSATVGSRDSSFLPDSGNDSAVSGEIAIIGLAGRYPQADSVAAYWENLKSGKDCISEIPTERWSLENFFESNPDLAVAQGKSYSKWGGFVDGFADFDPLFFGISPREAEDMDPQERLFLESAWHVFEDAGYSKKSIKQKFQGNVGVFAGITKTGFDLYGNEPLSSGSRSFPHTSFGSVANRVSYILDLHGPSMPVDTMCSSSLTAIHYACEQLRAGSCKMAIAGGVNLYLHPRSYVKLCSQRMLSQSGRCKSFGAGGDGFVPGEGVGAVLLKPLEDAERDGDHIYAVIKATAINHGGKTQGFTVPNPNAQAEVIGMALDRARIDPSSISYIEAHGTGTELGDPIEITGLKKAFDARTPEPLASTCSIGSVKSSIGHLEAAAGIAALTKVILQLQNKLIVPSLNAEEPNPNINFSTTPFVVQQDLNSWQVDSNEISETQSKNPLTAGISSFGAGGSNAHIIVSEYVGEKTSASETKNRPGSCHPIPLSANSQPQLITVAKNLLAHLQQLPSEDLTVRDLAYTLQVGREAMEQRMVIISNDIGELKEKLEKISLQNLQDGGWIYSGAIEGIPQLLDREKGLDPSAKSQLLSWIDGRDIDWDAFYLREELPRRLSLPCYPFERQTYWFEKISDATTSSTAKAVLHPFLHDQVNDHESNRFVSVFSGSEFFLRDHKVSDVGVFPAVAFLEMANAAIQKIHSNNESIELSDVVWMRTAQASPELELEIQISRPENQNAKFTITKHSKDEGNFVCCQGKAEFSESRALPDVNLDQLLSECQLLLSAKPDIYGQFKDKKITYGPEFQAIEKMLIGVNADGRPQVVAELELPNVPGETKDNFSMHPVIMDAALQAVIGLNRGASSYWDDGDTLLPFAMEKLVIRRPTPGQAYAWIRMSDDFEGPESAPKVDISLCSSNGEICIEISGLSFRKIVSQERSGQLEKISLLSPKWNSLEVDEKSNTEVRQWDKRYVLVWGDSDGNSKEMLSTLLESETVVDYFSPSESSIEERYENFAQYILKYARNIVTANRSSSCFLQLVVPSTKCLSNECTEASDGACLAGVAGLLVTLEAEHPNVVTQLLSTSCVGDEKNLAKVLEEGAMRSHLRELRENQGCIEYRVFEELNRGSLLQAPTPWRNGGVYLVTGGAGGLGLIFAESIARSTKGCSIVLIGRSADNSESVKAVQQLEQLGACAEYRAVDISEKESVTELVDYINSTYQNLNGVIHSAGIIKDSLIVNKDSAAMHDVMSPKVAGVVNLDFATRSSNLDFFIGFSALAAILGNAGQSDYAAANRFMDEYLAHRAELVSLGQRKGRTLSLNWPLWANGGMTVDAAVARAFQERGMGMLDSDKGVETLIAAYAADASQVAIAIGEQEFLDSLLHCHESRMPEKETNVTNVSVPDSGQLTDEMSRFLRQLLCDALKVPVERMDIDTPVDKYGLDSIVAVEVIGELEKEFGNLPKTLFFEFRTIAELSNHFIQLYPEQSWRALRGSSPDAGNVKDPVVPAIEVTPGDPKGIDLKVASTGSIELDENTDANDSDIAIIGIEGSYAKSRNLDELWANLIESVDCIEEVPSSHWNVDQIFNKEKGVDGATYCKWGGFLEGIDEFDAAFFNISPKEARTMDPQQRLFLQQVWHLMQSCGLTQDKIENDYDRSVGVYLGTMYQQYGGDNPVDEAIISSSSYNAIANRVSAFYGLEGPSLAVDTMCSSSAMAIHLACQGLLQEDCELAIAGGVNLSIHPNKYIALSSLQMLGSSSTSRGFSDGDGYLPSEGVGAILLKRKDKALQDGDRIFAVIKGTATVHSGLSNGFMVPNLNKQVQVMEQCLHKSQVSKSDVSYIEAAANGSALGDQIELDALNRVFGDSISPDKKIPIGSVKSILGHPEAVSGMAQLSKIVMQFRHGQLAPTLVHSHQASERFKDSPFVLQTRPQKWERGNSSVETSAVGNGAAPNRALINSFGAGGSYVSILLEEFVEQLEEVTAEPVEIPRLITLSAKSRDSLHKMAGQLEKYLNVNSHCDLGNLAYTLNVGREGLNYRLGFIANSISEVILALQAFTEKLEVERNTAIPTLVTGNVDEELSGLKEILSGKSADGFIRSLVLDKDLYRLASYWVKGGRIPWDEMYQGERHELLKLPAYPFQRRHFWTENNRIRTSEAEVKTNHTVIDVSGENKFPNGNGKLEGASDIEIFISNFFCQALDYGAEEVPPSRKLKDLGADSVLINKLVKTLHEKYGVKITRTDLLKHESISALASIIDTRKHGLHSNQDFDPKSMNGRLSPSISLSSVNEPNALDLFKNNKISIEEVKEKIFEELGDE